MTDLDLHRPYYRPGDAVWIVCEAGIFPGEVLKRYESTPGWTGKMRPLRKQHPMYYVFTRFAGQIHKSGVSRRRYAVYVRRSQLVPRMAWEQRPLQRLEPFMEVNVERVRDYLRANVPGGTGEALPGQDLPATGGL